MPGAGKQSSEVQEQIKELLEAGFDPTTIHRRLKVGRSSIYRMKRSLQQHGTPYMPAELNKKNGRPKVLTAEQELGVRDWLRDAKNRTRYLDDLVWLIHDRYGIVCSTTTMSKLKRKWIRVLECEESGQPLDEHTHSLLAETHPDLPILSQPTTTTQTMLSNSPSGTSVQNPYQLQAHNHHASQAAAAAVAQMVQRQQHQHDQEHGHMLNTDDLNLDPKWHLPPSLHQHEESNHDSHHIDPKWDVQPSHHDHQMLSPQSHHHHHHDHDLITDPRLHDPKLVDTSDLQQSPLQQHSPNAHMHHPQLQYHNHSHNIDSRLEQQIHREIATADISQPHL